MNEIRVNLLQLVDICGGDKCIINSIICHFKTPYTVTSGPIIGDLLTEPVVLIYIEFEWISNHLSFILNKWQADWGLRFPHKSHQMCYICDHCPEPVFPLVHQSRLGLCGCNAIFITWHVKRPVFEHRLTVRSGPRFFTICITSTYMWKWVWKCQLLCFHHLI